MAGGALVTGKRTSTFLLQWVIGSPKCAGILGRVWANKFTGVVHCSTFLTHHQHNQISIHIITEFVLKLKTTGVSIELTTLWLFIY